jgi:hypothetical protein
MRIRIRAVPAIAALSFALLVEARVGGAQPQASPAPATTPGATPMPAVTQATSPAPRPLGLTLRTDASATLIDQSSAGEGQIGPEAPGFIAGAPLAPNTPYDLFSSAPLVPGVTGMGELLTSATYGLRRFDLSAAAGLGYVRGSTTNAAYWGENLLPTLNPHLGSAALPYAVAFPTHAGQDDSTATRVSILSGAIATADGKLALKGGWFDLAQTDRFVFAQPALTSVNPALAYAPAETLAPSLAGSDLWQPYASALPLHGFDVVAKRGIATLELSSAALPSLPGESARLTMGSLVSERGEGTRFSAQLVHVTTSGLPFLTTVPFGVNPQFVTSPQGRLPTSTLDGQHETIAGLRAAFHLAPAFGLDGVVEIGRAWYDADPVTRPGTEKPGGYYHLGFSKVQGRATATLDFYRMEPRYATLILPYGIPENQWSTAFAWPGQWLKSNYQLIDNSVLGVNRQGYRIRYYVDRGPLEVHLEYTDLRQIEPETTATSTQAGFVDGFYLPQLPDAATFGRQRRYAFWAAWHPSIGDLTLDVVDDTLFRPFAAAHPEDQVSYEVPQYVMTYSRRVSRNVVAATGFGRYAAKGVFSEPIDFSQRLFFTGLAIEQTPTSSVVVSFRRTAFEGITTFPSSALSPDFTGSAIVIEQRLRL